MRTLAKRIDHRRLAGGQHAVFESKLYHLDGNDLPHFSVTGTIYRSTAWAKRALAGHDVPDGYIDSCGALGDLAAKMIAALRPVAALHLSDSNGVPLHAFENGWYWYSDYDGMTAHLAADDGLTPLERAANYLRMPADELEPGLSREAFRSIVNLQRPRWKREAAAALSIIRQGGNG